MTEDTETEETASCPNLALVAIAHGKAVSLYRDVNEYIDDHIDGVSEADAFEECGQWPPCEGVYVCELSLIDDGPGDWPGAREYRLAATKHRRCTPDEWESHLVDEHLWRTHQEILREPEATFPPDAEVTQ